MTNTFDRLVKVLMKTYDIDKTKMSSDSRLDELGVDSLGVGLMLFDLEDEFKIKFCRDPGPLQVLGDVVLYIDEVIIEQPRISQAGATSLSAS